MTFNPRFNRPIRLFVPLPLLFLALNNLAEASPRPVRAHSERWLAVRQSQGPITDRRQGGDRFQLPAGVSAVQGSVLGLSVQASGKATLNRKVTTAQGKTIFVPRGFQNITIPREKPTSAASLRNNTELHYQIEQQIRAGIQSFRLAGQVDPVDLILLGASPPVTDRTGSFSLLLSAVPAQTLAITVMTLRGRKQVHQLSIRL